MSGAQRTSKVSVGSGGIDPGEKGAPNGVASLDSEGFVPPEQVARSALVAALTGVHRGAWAASTLYKQGQIVTFSGMQFLANSDHTSGLTFGLANWTRVGVRNAERQTFDPRAYGAVFDAAYISDAAMTSGSKILTTAQSVAADRVGKVAVVIGAGAAGASLVTTIGSVTPDGSGKGVATLVDAASTSVSGAGACWGTDDTTAIQAAASACNTAGGGYVDYSFGSTIITGVITHATRVMPIGRTPKQDGTSLTRIFCASATAQILLNGQTMESHGGLFIDGMKVATECLRFDDPLNGGGYRLAENVRVTRAAQDNIGFYRQQNSVFINFVADFAGRDNVRLDNSVGGSKWVNLKTVSAGRNELRSEQVGAATGGYSFPEHNVFDHAIFESNAAAGCVYIAKGALTFYSPRFHSGSPGTMAALVEIAAAAGDVTRIINPDFSWGGTNTAIKLGSGSKLSLQGVVQANGGGGYILNLAASCTLWAPCSFDYFGSIAAVLDPASPGGADGPGGAIAAHLRFPTIVQRGATTGAILVGRVTGESGNRVLVQADGKIKIAPAGDSNYTITFDPANAAQATLARSRKTASYTLVNADLAKVIELNSASATVVSVPAGLADGWWCQITRWGAGAVSVQAVGGSGVVIRSDSGLVNISGQYTSAILRCVGGDEFILEGALS